MLLSALCDAYDGRVARKYKYSKEQKVSEKNISDYFKKEAKKGGKGKQNTGPIESIPLMLVQIFHIRYTSL